MYTNYSVLMSVYQKENPDFLKISIESMMNQTLRTDDFVLVCDGPLTLDLNKVVQIMQNEYKDVFHVVRLTENHGLGYALNVGVSECKNEIIARMDSDDISKVHRCEKQLKYLNEHKDISIVGSLIEEFSVSPDIVETRRCVPENNEDIIRFAKTRNPFNHPSVMFKKSDVIGVGNYPDVRFMQDYYLWIDMLIAGKKGHNIQEPLVLMRAGSSLFKRRSGKLYLELQINLFKKMKEAGFITRVEYYKSILIRSLSSVAPNWLRKLAFKYVLRK